MTGALRSPLLASAASPLEVRPREEFATLLGAPTVPRVI